jgi:hypothetical protein
MYLKIPSLKHANKSCFVEFFLPTGQIEKKVEDENQIKGGLSLVYGWQCGLTE